MLRERPVRRISPRKLRACWPTGFWPTMFQGRTSDRTPPPRPPSRNPPGDARDPAPSVSETSSDLLTYEIKCVVEGYACHEAAASLDSAGPAGGNTTPSVQEG